MPTSVFLELDEEKRSRIITAALNEFADKSFGLASTNTIVKSCGISKGSLFKYFESKEDLYFYLIDVVSARMAQDMADKISDLPTDIYERVIAYSSLEISYYIEHPSEGKLLTNLAAEHNSEIAQKIRERYGDTVRTSYEQLLQGTGIDKKRADILRWVLEGFNRDFLECGGSADEYVKSLTEYMDLVRGIL